MHVESPEYWLFLTHWSVAVGVVNCCLLWMVALSKIPHQEASYWLVCLLGVSGVLNLGMAFLQYHGHSFVAKFSTAMLFLAGTAAFVAASRVHQALQLRRVLEQWEEKRGSSVAEVDSEMIILAKA
ncbi:hypothetical protein CPB85DRAFT_1315288 [Mucidula mucida]|nr:hypothetical protein CPB85DRAFT_1315288 [Mucidula mucida]